MTKTKMLQAVLDGQVAIREDIGEVKLEVKKNGKRIDKLGLQLARLEDDTPTIEEFVKFEKRVTKVEKHISVVA